MIQNMIIKKKNGFLEKISKLKLNYCLIIALSIMVGELGDKTFLASLGFGIKYPNSKFMLVLGCIFYLLLDMLQLVYS